MRIRARLSALAATFALPAVALANQAPGVEPAAPDPKKLFAANCAWCHNNYGLDAGKGPKLAGTTLSAKGVYERIANGKSGAMPAYKRMLSEDQIQALTDYIKSLPAD
jgi:mono/diheme cytochrome c family protein